MLRVYIISSSSRVYSLEFRGLGFIDLIIGLAVSLGFRGLGKL